jgi:hypothetical protein
MGVHLIFENKKKGVLDELTKESFAYQFNANKISLPEDILNLIVKKYDGANIGIINCTIFLEDFRALT